MLRLKDLSIVESTEQLKGIPDGKVLINTINAHSFRVAQRDEVFAEALSTMENGKWRNENEEGYVKYLIPDGAGIVMACQWLKTKSQPKERIAGWDLFTFEMQKQNEKGKMRNEKCHVMFLESSNKVLSSIRERAAVDYTNLEVVTYSPPDKPASLWI